VLPEDPIQNSYVIHLLTDDVNPYSIGFHVPSFRIPENTQVMPVLVVPGTTLAGKLMITSYGTHSHHPGHGSRRQKPF